jgi:phospholipid/cholesterol/gamma-HCH transport system substrate-binding protein
MRSSKINYLVVGVFVIGMVAALVVSVALLTGRTGATDRYYSYYSNVTGVKFGTQVVYEGYPIGQVEEVTPEEKDGRMRFRVDFGVLEDWRIPTDSVVEIAAPGLLAAVTLSIHAGKDKASLKPGDEVKSRERSDIFAVVSSVASDFGELTETNVKPLLANVNRAVETINRIMEKEGENLFRDARKATSDLGGVVAVLAEKVPQITGDIEVFIGKMNKTSDEFQKLMTPANREKLEAAVTNLNKASLQLNVILKDVQELTQKEDGDVRKTVAETRYIVESVSRHIDSINQNMEGAARNMYEFTRQIRQNPGLLLGSQAPEDKGAARPKP